MLNKIKKKKNIGIKGDINILIMLNFDFKYESYKLI